MFNGHRVEMNVMMVSTKTSVVVCESPRSPLYARVGVKRMRTQGHVCHQLCARGVVDALRCSFPLTLPVAVCLEVDVVQRFAVGRRIEQQVQCLHISLVVSTSLGFRATRECTKPDGWVVGVSKRQRSVVVKTTFMGEAFPVLTDDVVPVREVQLVLMEAKHNRQ